MKFCLDHWAKLRTAIDKRGLSSLVATSGEQAAAQLTKEIEEGPSEKTFDPLMGAHNAIISRALGLVGLALMQANEDGSDRCPICFLQAEHDAHCTKPDCAKFETWIDSVSDFMRTEAIRLGLLATDS